MFGGPPSSKYRQVATASGASVEASSRRASARRSPGKRASLIPRLSRQRRKLVDAVAPIVGAAEQPREDERAPRRRVST